MSKVLYVEDFDDNYRVVDRYICTFSPEIELKRATTLEEMFQMLEQDTYSLILFDIYLPDHAIEDLGETVKRIQQLHGEKIIALTSETNPNIKSVVKSAGITEYYTKPIMNFPVFLETLNQHVFSTV